MHLVDDEPDVSLPTRTDQKFLSLDLSILWKLIPGLAGFTCRSKAVVFTSFCSSPVSRARLAYLIRVRLHRVRQALLAATPGSTTVSAEALRWGFWHFGEFSRAYRNCFNELPSETLRQRRAEPLS